jgi:signal transduction histidine kinase
VVPLLARSKVVCICFCSSEELKEHLSPTSANNEFALIDAYEKSIVDGLVDISNTDRGEVLANVSTAAAQFGVLLERKLTERELAENYEKIKSANAELIETQRQLIQSEKMASIGQLAAGVAHEINNPVGFVHSNVCTLKDYMNDLFQLYDIYKALEVALAGPASDSKEAECQVQALLLEARDKKHSMDFDFIEGDVKELIDESHGGLIRVRDIVAQLKNFARSDEDALSECSVNDLLDNTLKVIWNELKYSADLVKQYSEVPTVACNDGQICQVLINLMINASQAIDGQGTITLATRFDDTYVYVDISDTGKGIDEADLVKIFDPFYTTKPVGVGTGLGLSISFGIIERHGGKVSVVSEPGVGTTFTFSLPRKRADSAKL